MCTSAAPQCNVKLSVRASMYVYASKLGWPTFLHGSTGGAKHWRARQATQILGLFATAAERSTQVTARRWRHKLITLALVRRAMVR